MRAPESAKEYQAQIERAAIGTQRKFIIAQNVWKASNLNT